MYRVRSQPLYPFLLAVYPVLHLYASNLGYVVFEQILPVMGTVLLATIGIYLLSRLVFQNATRAGLFTALVLLLFFSYGHVYTDGRSLLQQWVGTPEGIIRHRYLLVIYGLVFVLGTLLIVKKGHRFYGGTPYLNVMAIAMVMIVGVRIGWYRWQMTDTNTNVVNTLTPYTNDIPRLSVKRGNMPDIYYIILDGYGRADVLKDCYDFDNSEFIRFLEDRGFYVASASQSNYPYTSLSIPSSLNMTYQDTNIDLSIDHNRVEQALKSLGYEIVRLDSKWQPSNYSDTAEVNYGAPVVSREFTAALLQTTIIQPFSIFVVYPYLTPEELLAMFDELAEIPKHSGATFTFAHILSPHPPYLFDRNGNIVSLMPNELNAWLDKSGYVDQLLFLNKKVEVLVETLLHSDTPPIIILQADHGPFCKDPLSPEFWNAKFGILNAYYLPEGGIRKLYPSITPVNSFRVVLDYYFGADLGLLEDKTYIDSH